MRTLGDVGAGHVLGRYELLMPIASGGMATVWAARLKGTRGFQKIVAVKTMLPTMTDDPQFEQMFLDEATIAARIKHPNVVEILDLGEDNGVLFIVMEWVDGEPLSMVIKTAARHGGIPLPVAARIATQTCSGLHAAHELRDDDGQLIGLVHRDVSPQNVLVNFDGVVKIVDFGVAKATTAAQSNATQAGQIKGKAAYMSPEQARGFAIDRRTDVFAMGILLYQLTTGKHPFRGENEAQSLLNICSDDPALPPSRLVANYPPSLETVVMRALEKDLNRRYASASELLHALDRAVPIARSGIDEQVAGFMRKLFAERKARRDRALRDALRIAAERGASAVRVQFPGANPGESSGTGFTPPSHPSHNAMAQSLRGSGAASARQPSAPSFTGSQPSIPPVAPVDPSSASHPLAALTPSMGSLGSAAAEIQLQTAMASAQANRRTTTAVLTIGGVALALVAVGAVYGFGGAPRKASSALPSPAPIAAPPIAAASMQASPEDPTHAAAEPAVAISADPVADRIVGGAARPDGRDAGGATAITAGAGAANPPGAMPAAVTTAAPRPWQGASHAAPRPTVKEKEKDATQSSSGTSGDGSKAKPSSSVFVPAIRNPGF